VSAYLAVGEAAEALGCNPRTIYDGVRAGTIPHSRVGRRVFIPAAWLDAGGPETSNGHATPDPERFAADIARAVAVELARLLGEAAARATTPDAESGVVLDLIARDDEEGRHGG
jgi:excisionase family DNA binding protein